MLIVSVDGGCTGVKAVQDGKIAATSQQYPLKMAAQGVDAVVKFAKDGTKASGYTDTGVTLITAKPATGVESKDIAFGLDELLGLTAGSVGAGQPAPPSRRSHRSLRATGAHQWLCLPEGDSMSSTQTVSDHPARHRPDRGRRWSRGVLTTPTVGPLIFLVLAIVFFSIKSSAFLTGGNFSLIVQQVMVVGTLAIGQTLIILTAGIDLSVGAVMALGQIVIAKLAVDSGLNPILAILLGLAATAAFGLRERRLVHRLRLPPFIVTLGT